MDGQASETTAVATAVNAAPASVTKDGATVANSAPNPIDSYKAMMQAELAAADKAVTEGTTSPETTETTEQETATAPEQSQETTETPDGDESSENGDETETATETPAKPPQYRWRPKTEIDNLAMQMVKSAEKAGRDLTLSDALAEAQRILKPADATTEQQTETNPDEPESFKALQTVDDVKRLRLSLATERKKAMGIDLDFERAAQIDYELTLLTDKEKEIAGAQDAEDLRYSDAVTKSQNKALERYPDTGNAESPLVAKMAEIDATWKSTNDPKYFDTDKPLLLATIAASELGIAPKASKPASQPTAKQSPRPTTKPAVPAPLASGAARTTTPGQAPSVDTGKIRTTNDYEHALKELGLNR
jgi:hypothetical protein